MKEAKSLVERDSIVLMTAVNFAHLRNDTAERKIFDHPQVLIRLSYLLMGIQKNRKKEGKEKPFVVSY
jgi:hypothetical protein